MTVIQDALHTVNPLVRSFKSGAEMFTLNPSTDFTIVFKAKSSQGARKQHLNPDVTNVVIVAPGQQTQPRDVVLYRTTADAPNHRQTTTINELHPMYDPTAYPLILPHGDAGFSIDNAMHKVNAT